MRWEVDTCILPKNLYISEIEESIFVKAICGNLW